MRHRLKVTITAMVTAALVTSSSTLFKDRELNSTVVGVHYSGACAGVCPCFSTRVRDDGRVSTLSCLPYKLGPKYQEFSVPLREVAQFKKILAPLRDGPKHRGNCVRPEHLADQRAEWVVEWWDEHPTKLVACFDPEVDQSIDHALLAIGAPFSGWKMDPAHLKDAAAMLQEIDRHRR